MTKTKSDLELGERIEQLVKEHIAAIRKGRAGGGCAGVDLVRGEQLALRSSMSRLSSALARARRRLVPRALLPLVG